MNVNPSASRMATERGDCTVRAVAKAFGVDYDIAHEWLRKAGRKDRTGFFLGKFFKLGFTKDKKTSRTFKGRRIFFRSPKREPTIITFLKKNPKGTFVCSKRHHAFCIIDGLVYGQPVDHSRIQYYWKIYPPKIKKEKQIAA